MNELSGLDDEFGQAFIDVTDMEKLRALSEGTREVLDEEKGKVRDKAAERFAENKRRRSNYWVMLKNALLYSESFRALGYCPALKVYAWSLMKIPTESRKDERARQKLGRKNPATPSFSFPHSEAECFGLTRKQFARALRELVRVGLLDVEHKGSSRHGDFSEFRFSDRWRNFGKKDFKEVSFPENQRHLPRGKDGRWESLSPSGKQNPPLPLMADLRNRAKKFPCEIRLDRPDKGGIVPLEEGTKGKDAPMDKGRKVPVTEVRKNHQEENPAAEPEGKTWTDQ